MNKFNIYNQRYQAFANITDMNMEDILKMVPDEKHFWVTELITIKNSRNVLLKKKKKLKQALTEKVIKDGIVNLNKKTLDDIENSDQFEDINNTLEEMDSLVEYLELIVKNITFIGNDFKNILTLKQLQE
jgi:hypothetical protein